MKWLLANGAKFPNVFIKRYTDGLRGVEAKSTIYKGEVVVSVPLKCIIMNDLGQSSCTGQRLIESGYSARSQVMLVVYVLEEMESENSFFQPYFDTLPRNYDSFPVKWSEKELSRLDGSKTKRFVSDRRANSRDEYNSICKIVPEFERFPYPLFFWAELAVGSRTFGTFPQMCM